MVHLQNAVIRREPMTVTDGYYQTLTSVGEEIFFPVPILGCPAEVL